MSNPVIEGYQFACENWCPRCLSDEFGCAESDLESVLDQIATDAGINRADEHSYDSQDFPKRTWSSETHGQCTQLAGCVDLCMVCGDPFGLADCYPIPDDDWPRVTVDSGFTSIVREDGSTVIHAPAA